MIGLGSDKNREEKQFSSFNKQHHAWQRRENLCCFLGRNDIKKGTGKALVKLRNNTSDWGNNTGGVHPCLDYTLRDYSRLDYLWLDYKDIWTITIWTTYDVWTTAVWTTPQIDYTPLDYLWRLDYCRLDYTPNRLHCHSDYIRLDY